MYSQRGNGQEKKERGRRDGNAGNEREKPSRELGGTSQHEEEKVGGEGRVSGKQRKEVGVGKGR